MDYDKLKRSSLWWMRRDKQKYFPPERCLYNLKQLILAKSVNSSGAGWHGSFIKAHQSITCIQTLFGRPATPATCLDAWESIRGANPERLFMFASKEEIWSYSNSLLLILMKMSTENNLLSWHRAHLFWQMKVWQCILLWNSVLAW